jgi:dUTP pyrophosphatase
MPVTNPTTENMEESNQDISDITSTISVSTHNEVPNDIRKHIDDMSYIHPVDNVSHMQVCFKNPDVKSFYAERPTSDAVDSGWDLHTTEEVVVGPREKVVLDFQLSVACTDEHMQPMAVWLVPRSSIIKTPLIMANSMGLIDSTYRGSIKACVINQSDDETYTIKKGDRLFQLAAPSLKPFHWQNVDSLESTARGENGFGSTGK